MKKIAIIVFGHPESILPLAKHLSDTGNLVDYFFIAFLKSKYVPAFDFGGVLIKPDINRLSRNRIPYLYNYMYNTT